jgi:hypothetical protein
MSSIFKARVSSSDDAVRRELLELHSAFSASSVPQLATSVVYEDMMRQKLRWHRRGSGEPDYRRKVPLGYQKSIQQIIESVMQVGYFSYTLTEDEFPLRIGHVLETLPYLDTDGEIKVRPNLEYRGGIVDADWRIVVFSRPIFAFDDGGKYAGAGLRIIHSGLSRALKLVRYHSSMLSNFNLRDAANSRHSGFTSASTNLTNPHGSSETWFSNGGATSHELLADVMSGAGGVESLVRNRAEMIRKLEAESSLSRAAITRTNAEGDLVDRSEVGGSDAYRKEHAEFMVSDGYTLHEAGALLSMANSQPHFEKLENTILFLLGVPPQALGKNINSERLAASNSLTQAALRVFHGTVSRFREVCDGLFELIPAGTLGPKGSRVAFSECLTQYDLDKLAPFIAREKLPHLYACAYDVDPGMFDPELLRKHADGLLSSSSDPGSGKRKRKEESDGISSEEREKQNAAKSAKITEKEASSNG